MCMSDLSSIIKHYNNSHLQVLLLVIVAIKVGFFFQIFKRLKLFFT